MWHVVYISACTLTLYIAFNSAANLQSQMMEDNGFDQFGFYILSVLYLFMGIGSLLSTAAIKLFGTKACLMTGGLSCTLWIVSMVLATITTDYGKVVLPKMGVLAIIFVVSAFNGLAVGVLMAAAASYISDCTTPKNSGLYFSIFVSFYASS